MTTLEQLAEEALDGVSISLELEPLYGAVLNANEATFVRGTVKNSTVYRLLDIDVWTEASGAIELCKLDLTEVGYGSYDVNGYSWEELQPGATGDFNVFIKGVQLDGSMQVEVGILKAWIKAEVVPVGKKIREQLFIDVYPPT